MPVFDLSSDKNVKELYLPSISARTQILYWCILLFIIIILACLSLIKVDVSVKSTGIIRPSKERTDLKSPTNALIEYINFQEGDTVSKGAIIIKYCQF
jgi:multidrug efflux pump subunit AcrA (membrane-fusion protein)